MLSKPLAEGKVLLFQQDTIRDECFFGVFHKMALAHHPSLLLKSIMYAVPFTPPRPPGRGAIIATFQMRTPWPREVQEPA